MKHASRHAAGLPGVLIATALLGLAACASAPVPPTQALQAAEMAIASAEQARVADFASLELAEARQELAAARTAVQQNRMVQAERLALESRAGAELALARAEAARSKVVNDDMRKSNDTLQQEMERNPGVRP